MKSKLLISLIFLICIAAAARMVSVFSSWDSVEWTSKDILVVVCGKPVEVNMPPNSIVTGGPKSDSEVQVISVLKGTNGLGSARLKTDHDLHQGEHYLVFGNFDGRVCTSLEEYKVIPIGKLFSTNSIAGKSLEEQLKILFRHAVFELNREIEQDQAQKAELEILIGK
jgi:hypothetical protein